MAPQTDRLLHYVRRMASQAAPEPGDAVLLSRFVARRDEAAFAMLVARHGPMVLRVCRRLIANTQDAEDAFQATFLVLARKAASVRPLDALAVWLRGVARRVALGACAAASRQQRREAASLDLAPLDPCPDPLSELTAPSSLVRINGATCSLPKLVCTSHACVADSPVQESTVGVAGGSRSGWLKAKLDAHARNAIVVVQTLIPRHRADSMTRSATSSHHLDTPCLATPEWFRPIRLSLQDQNKISQFCLLWP